MKTPRLLALTGLTGLALALTACDGASIAAPDPTPAHSVIAAPLDAAPADGLVLGDGPVRVDLWTDVSCPYCAHLDAIVGPDLALLVGDGSITLAIHPMNYVSAKHADETAYSSRGASMLASAYATGPASAVLPLYSLLQENQSTPDDDELSALARQAGALAASIDPSATVTYQQWVQSANDHWLGRELADGSTLSAVPTLLVAGERFTGRGEAGDAERLRAQIAAAR